MKQGSAYDILYHEIIKYCTMLHRGALYDYTLNNLRTTSFRKRSWKSRAALRPRHLLFPPLPPLLFDCLAGDSIPNR